MRTHRFGRKIKLRDNRHQTSDQNSGMALYDVEKSEAEVSRGQDHHLLDAVSGGGFHGFPGHSFGGGFRAPGGFGRMGGNFGGARFGGNGNGIGAGIAGAILGLAAGAAGSAIYAQPPVVYAPAPVYDDQGPSTYGQPPAPSYAPLQQGDPGLLQVPAPPQLAPPQEQARGLGKEVEATS